MFRSQQDVQADLRSFSVSYSYQPKRSDGLGSTAGPDPLAGGLIAPLAKSVHPVTLERVRMG